MSKMVDLELEVTVEEKRLIEEAAVKYFSFHASTPEHRKYLRPWYHFKKDSFAGTKEGMVAMWVGTVLEEECKRLSDEAFN